MQSILPGWQSSLNHHPVFVHFPIVLWLTALLFEIVAVWRKDDPTHRTAVWLLWLGTVAGTFAVGTGLSAAKSVPENLGPVLAAHEQLMLTAYFIALGLSAFALFAGRRLTHGLKVVVLVGLLILAIIVTIGADRGGEMVYRYGLGVNWTTAVHQTQHQNRLPK
jgi:uncharacterized membrane protein